MVFRAFLGLGALVAVAGCAMEQGPPCFIAGDQAAWLSSRSAEAMITGGSTSGGCVVLTLDNDFELEPGAQVAGRVALVEGGESLSLTGVDLDGIATDGTEENDGTQVRLSLTATFAGPITEGATSASAAMQVRIAGPDRPVTEESALPDSVTVTITRIDRAAGMIYGTYGGQLADYGFGRYGGSFAAPVTIGG
jgi:hypothetical protein